MTLQIADVLDQKTLDIFNTQSLGSAGLAAGTTSTLSTANAFHYRISGQAYLKAAALNATPTTLAAVASGVTAYYLVTIKADGTVVLTAPPVARAGDPDVTGLLLGALPANQAVIGIAKLVSTASFTWGSTTLGTQVTFANINSYPANGDPTVFTYA